MMAPWFWSWSWLSPSLTPLTSREAEVTFWSSPVTWTLWPALTLKPDSPLAWRASGVR